MKKIYQTGENRYAIGEPGKRADYVIDVIGRLGHGGKAVGVRGVRPMLDGRHPEVKPSKNLSAAFDGVA